MKTKKYQSAVIYVLVNRMVNASVLLLVTSVFLPQTVFAKQDSTENEKEYNSEAPVDEVKKTSNVRAIETGVGGALKQESEQRTAAESQFKLHAHLAWESRYVSEGRDNLAGNSITSVSSEFDLGELSILPWLAHSSGADYSELDVNVVYGKKLTESLTIYAGYDRIFTRQSGDNDDFNEVSLGLSYDWLKHVKMSALTYYSFEAEGSFIDASVSYQHTLKKNLDFSVHGKLGANAGYISDGHNGLNHAHLLTSVDYHPLIRLDVYAYLGYNQAINRDAERYAGDGLLGDFIWGGVGFTYRF
jgi:hypothetical protein